MKLFRAMSRQEWADMQASGKFRPGPPSFQGKWFAESLADAIAWGKLLHPIAATGFLVIEIDLPQTVADQFFRLPLLDGIGPARFADVTELDVLKGTAPQVVATFP
jgi:hypothetical protein